MSTQAVLALLERHGWNATSFQILEPGFQYWFDGDDACVGYVDTGRAWVAAGSPIAPTDRLAEVSEKFAAAAAAAGRRVSYFATEERFCTKVPWRALRIGDQPVWSPAEWAGVLGSSRSLREQIRRAKAKGVSVREVAADELAIGHPTRAALDDLIARWLASRPIAPMGFLVQIDPFSFPERKHYFVAEQAGRPVGFLGVVPIYARSGWFFEDFLRDPDAPNGSVELLVDAGMRAAAADHVELVTLGLVPLAGDVSRWLRAVRRFGRALYDFDGLRAFKSKFKPKRWDPIYLSYPPTQRSPSAVLDTLTAFSRGGLLKFGFETLLRGPAIIFRLLAVALAAWTVMLALPVATPYFPSAIWQYSWVGFDIVLCGALFALAARWRQPLADIVAIAVTGDAVVTAGEAILYNIPRADSVTDGLVIAAAIAAPTIAAFLLWNARVHRD